VSPVGSAHLSSHPTKRFVAARTRHTPEKKRAIGWPKRDATSSSGSRLYRRATKFLAEA
jgi:hypothetical protein